MSQEAHERKFGVGIDADTHRELLRLSRELGQSHKTIVRRAVRLYAEVHRSVTETPVMEVRRG
mgnify:CR=1 FL=1